MCLIYDTYTYTTRIPQQQLSQKAKPRQLPSCDSSADSGSWCTTLSCIPPALLVIPLCFDGKAQDHCFHQLALHSQEA